MNIALSWYVEHTNIKRLLDFLERRLSVFHDSGRPNYHEILEVATYLRHFPDRYHHARENIAFGYLVLRDPGARTTTDCLLQEHSALVAKADGLCTQLFNVDVREVVRRAKVEATLATYLTFYRNHITIEDKDILPRAAEILTAAEWMSVARAAPPGPDSFRNYSSRRHNPTFGSEAEARYRELCAKISIGSSTRSSEHAFRNVDSRQENNLSHGETFAGSLTVPRPKNRVRSVVPAWRLSVRQVRPTVMLLALVLAYLQYYFLDVHLQIAYLPSISVFLFR